MSPLKTFLALVGIFLTAILATPTGPAPRALDIPAVTTPQRTVNASVPIIVAPNDRVDKCGDSSFHDTTDSASSPTISDCLVIAKNIAGGGRWEVEAFTADHHQLVQFGTCALGVKAVPPYGDAFFYVGNSDIIDVINDSIRRFGRDSLVSAWGEMRCNALALGSSVKWDIYHNKQ